MTKPRILVVDDERQGVGLLARALRKLGRIEVASSAQDAWTAFREEPFELVISDQRMPGESGVELLTRVAKVSPHTGRILLTGFADQSATVAAINEARIHAYLYKPCPPDQLRMTCTNVMQRLSLEAENGRLLTELRERADELEEVVASLKLATEVRVGRARREERQALTAAITPALVRLLGTQMERREKLSAEEIRRLVEAATAL